VPFEDSKTDLYVCNECKRTAEVNPGDDPPWPWCEVVVDEQPDPLHGCCEGCATLIRIRYAKVLRTTKDPES
jgi:hypothetical protein